MAESQTQALTKRSSGSALMPPPPLPKRQKRPAKVLDEDVYTDALSHIIARDFFPGLLEIEAQKEYMEALESDDNDWIRQAGRKLTQVMTPVPAGQRRAGRGTSLASARQTTANDTPWTTVGETPLHPSIHSDSAPEGKPEVNMNLSLGAFQAKYTSEDNESFNALLDKQNEKRASKYQFFHQDNKIASARQIVHRAREQKMLEGGHSIALVTYNAAGEERQAFAGNRPSEDLSKRPASVDSFPNRQGPKNSFMFGPEEDTNVGIAAQASGADFNSRDPPKSIQYAATRFYTNTMQPKDTVFASPSMSAIDAAIAGRPTATKSDIGYNGVETPRVNGYAFVDAEPTQIEMGIPITDEEADAAEREAATKLLPKVDETGPNPFRITGRNKREDIHLRLVEKADAYRRKGDRIGELRDLGITPGRASTPRFSSGAHIRKPGMTPAAQKLATRIGTPKRERGAFGSDSINNTSWTPTPRSSKRI